VSKPLEFSFRSRVVGYFEEPSFPRTAGRYRYMPYRGPGHYELGQALAHGPARCSCVGEDGIVEFDVVSAPEYGVLEIDHVVPEGRA
jgi:hypothetical protein